MKRLYPVFLTLALLYTACPSTGAVRGNDPTAGVSKEVTDTLIGCINKAAADLTAVIPQGAILGVIKISSDTGGEGEFAEEQLIFCLVQNGKYRIVERRELDVIRGEQNFQLSGDVDDDTAVSIGRMSGAGIVITGSIIPYGAVKYFNIRALDVESAQILTAISRPFSGGL